LHAWVIRSEPARRTINQLCERDSSTANRSGSGTPLRSARCVAKTHSDQASSCFVGAGGIFNSINCGATGSLPIEARSDLVFIVDQQRHISWDDDVSGIFSN
jgi:hypothetical protein